MNGFINLLKPVGLSSSEAVVKVKYLLKDSGNKTTVGHMGTLDPLACGVLPIGVGKATRLFDYFLKKKKEYIAVFIFGKETDTFDSCGKVINTDNKIITTGEINAILPKFIGNIPQIPPMYSAISVNGVRAYDAARKGKDVNLKARDVVVDEIKVIEQIDVNTFLFDIKCGSGVYIRSLIRDIAKELNTVGYMGALIRTNSGKFDIESAKTLEEIESDVTGSIVSTEQILTDIETIQFDTEDLLRLKNGLTLNCNYNDGEYLIKEEGEALALACVNDHEIKLTVRLK